MFEETQGANCDCTDEEPLVEILMATYNGARYLGEQIDSILGQTYSHWRLLVNDDGSSDGTVDIVRAYAEKDDRIQLLSLENERHDAAGNFLALLAVSSAPYVMFCDQDDVWLPNKVQLELEAMKDLEREHGADVPLLVFTDSTVVDEDLNVLNPSFSSTLPYAPFAITLPQLMVDNVAQGCSMMLNRALSKQTLAYPLSDLFGMHDYWIMIVAKVFGRTKYLPIPTARYRQHSNNVCGAAKRRTTACAGVLHVLREPGILKGWLHRLAVDEKLFVERSRATLSYFAGFMCDDDRKALENLEGLMQNSLIGRYRTAQKYCLMRNQRTRYAQACQAMGIMLPDGSGECL